MFDYDVIVVGCGPTGLMATSELKAREVNVLGIDMKTRLDKNFRSASGFFFDDQEFNGECIRLEPKGDKTRIHYEKCGFSLDYPAPMEAIHNSYMVSNSGKNYQITSRNKPLYHIFNPTTWLSARYHNAKELGASFLTRTLVIKTKEIPGGVEVIFRKDGRKGKLTCKKLIASDGLQSRITRELGFNRNRGVIGIGPTIEYEMVGVECPLPRGDLFIFGEKNLGQKTGQIFMVPSPRGKDAYRIETATTPPAIKNYQVIEYFTKESSLAWWFKKASVVEKSGAVVELFTPIKVPHRGNIILVGDTAAFGEVLYQGATMCGYMAAVAVEKELRGHKGFDEYTQWWNSTFEWNIDPKKMSEYSKRFLFTRYMGADTMDYLFDIAAKQPLIADDARANVYDFAKTVIDHLLSFPEVRPDVAKKLRFMREADIGLMVAELAKEAQALKK